VGKEGRKAQGSRQGNRAEAFEFGMRIAERKLEVESSKLKADERT
jgi:hypothetical protein